MFSKASAQSHAAGTPIPWYPYGLVRQVDYHSFYPALMLAHRFGNDFRKLPKNPVLKPTPGYWDSKDVADPFVLVTADSVLLFYDGDNHEGYHIGYAVRDAGGWFWEKRGQIIGGSGGEWDAYHQIAPVVLPGEPGRRLYYNGHFEDEELGYRWGMALQTGGGRWEYPRSAPLMELDTAAWDFAGQAYGDILYIPEMGKYRMWYTGFQGPLAAIGLMESADGVHWQRVGEAPVLSLLPGVIAPEVIYNGERYRMFFVRLEVKNGRTRTAIYSAGSSDGLRWENIRPVLQPDQQWEGRRLMRPNLSYFEGRVWLYYCAGRGGRWKIGAAYTRAELAPRGIWRSPSLKAMGEAVEIRYALPSGTRLHFRWIDPADGTAYPADLTRMRTRLRRDVYRSVVSLPQTLTGRAVRIELILETEDAHHSPVVYTLRWGLYPPVQDER
ncbi:MAG: hypothetical protein D6681_20350 [Calditrichaeota bacterium]|nr:MAG: hypothetical protein D6681_20350 [Calditrichota bacterium]